MIDGTGEMRRRAFVHWMRTGEMLPVGDGIERKFNPWHDDATGRFTFAGAGGFFGGGTSIGASVRAKTPKPPAGRSASTGARAPGSWTGGGFTGGGGGSMGGGGASGSWTVQKGPVRALAKRPAATTIPTAALLRRFPGAAKTIVAASAKQPRTDALLSKITNGYRYEIDGLHRSQRISGELTIANKPVRSRSMQTRAGGADRRPSDDGGHYIAARFNGPVEAFNHFAQDSSFNRGAYRALEDKWAKAKKLGKHVFITLTPDYTGKSLRPDGINVSWNIDGHNKTAYFPNNKTVKRHGK